MTRQAVIVCVVLNLIAGFLGAAAGLSIGSPRTDVPVLRVVDGDTVVVVAEGKPMWVRIAAIDAPERGEPGGAESAAQLEAILRGKTIRLSFEGIPAKRWVFGQPVDPFGRLLAHVEAEFLGERADVGQVMIDAGHAVAWPEKE